MLGLGIGEMLVVAAVALIIVGPERLPKVMRQLGRWYGQARRAADELRRAFVLEADRQDATERYSELQERRAKAQAARKEAAKARIEAEGVAPDAGADDSSTPPVPVAQQTALPGTDDLAAEAVDDDAVDPNAHPPDAPHPDAARVQAAEEVG